MVYLSNIVEWEPGKEDVSEKLCHTEDSVHHPVGEPLSIVLFGGTFNGLNPGKSKGHHVGHWAKSSVTHLQAPAIRLTSCSLQAHIQSYVHT